MRRLSNVIGFDDGPFTREHRGVLARITPFYLDVPPNDAIYYPIYTKCVELDLPIDSARARAVPATRATSRGTGSRSKRRAKRRSASGLAAFSGSRSS